MRTWCLLFLVIVAACGCSEKETAVALRPAPPPSVDVPKDQLERIDIRNGSLALGYSNMRMAGELFNKTDYTIAEVDVRVQVYKGDDTDISTAEPAAVRMETLSVYVKPGYSNQVKHVLQVNPDTLELVKKDGYGNRTGDFSWTCDVVGARRPIEAIQSTEQASVVPKAVIPVGAHSATRPRSLGRCTGAEECDACTNCHSCKHCAQGGGTCGVCR